MRSQQPRGDPNRRYGTSAIERARRRLRRRRSRLRRWLADDRAIIITLIMAGALLLCLERIPIHELVGHWSAQVLAWVVVASTLPCLIFNVLLFIITGDARFLRQTAKSWEKIVVLPLRTIDWVVRWLIELMTLLWVLLLQIGQVWGLVLRVAMEFQIRKGPLRPGRLILTAAQHVFSEKIYLGSLKPTIGDFQEEWVQAREEDRNRLVPLIRGYWSIVLVLLTESRVGLIEILFEPWRSRSPRQ